MSGDVLRPSPEEIEAVRHPVSPVVMTRCAEWTAPTAVERDRLLTRLRHTPPAARSRSRSRSRPRSRWRVGLAAAAALLFSLRTIDFPNIAPSPPVEANASLSLPAGPLRLNPDIVAAGSGEMSIISATAQGARVVIASGAIDFEVDPNGVGRDLIVQAGAVEVRVTGTRFTVTHDAPLVMVSVARGSVEVRSPDGTVALQAGERWVYRPPPPPKPRRARKPMLTPTPPTAPEAAPMIEDGEGLFLALLEIKSAGMPPERVADSAKRFLDRYPDSPFRGEAAAIWLAALPEAQGPDVALREIEAWLMAHPQSPRRAELMQMAEKLAHPAP
ncbi:MAG: FecR domain-containing protein [Myxococcota bacterium]